MAKGARVRLTIVDPRRQADRGAAQPEHRVLAPPTATIEALVARLGKQVEALAGVRELLDASGMRLLPATLTVSQALAGSNADPTAEPEPEPEPEPEGQATGKMVASFGAPIFVHVPKTGGTTMIAALRQQSWQPHANDFHYRHIVYETTRSTTAELFETAALAGLAGQTVLTILREPLPRAISEYAFLRDRCAPDPWPPPTLTTQRGPCWLGIVRCLLLCPQPGSLLTRCRVCLCCGQAALHGAAGATCHLAPGLPPAPADCQPNALLPARSKDV